MFRQNPLLSHLSALFNQNCSVVLFEPNTEVDKAEAIRVHVSRTGVDAGVGDQ